MKTVIITGGDSQLAKCIKDSIKTVKGFRFLFLNQQALDITNKHVIELLFNDNNIDYCINCAAYTAVDKAETEPEIAQLINEKGVANLAEVCKTYHVTLIHLSTDFVFDGKQSKPYQENDTTNPLGVYGTTKLNGEQAIASILKHYFIIRTSWLYSEYGHNYLKTMFKLAKTKNALHIVYDQIGTPTYAGDLAHFILKIIADNHKAYGIYHYSHDGIAGWYDFTKAIFDISAIRLKVHPVETETYQQAATRPRYSVLDKSKTKKSFNIEIPYWRDRLKHVVLEKFKSEVNHQ